MCAKRQNEQQSKIIPVGKQQTQTAESLPSIKSEWPFVISIFIGLLILYIATMPPTVTLEDSGEYICTSFFAGFAHPPGYPTYSILGALFSHIPIGPVALRMHIFSAIAAAAACCCLYFCVLFVLERRILAILAALICGLSGTFWSQAIIAEVYALHAFFFFLLAAFAFRLNKHFDERTLKWAAFVFGLGLTNHWPLLILGSGTFLFLLYGNLHRVFRKLPILLLLMAVGLLPYLYIIVRSRFDPKVTAFGTIDSIHDFFYYLARTQYAQADLDPTATMRDTWLYFVFFFKRIVADLSIPIAFASVIGLFASWKKLTRPQFFAILWSIFSTSLLLTVFVRHDYDNIRNEVFIVYQVVPFGMLAFLASFSLIFLFQDNRLSSSTKNKLAIALSIGAITTCLATNFNFNDRHKDTIAHDYAKATLSALPQGAILITNSDMDTGPIAYAHLIEKMRPDITIYSRNGYIFKNRFSNSKRKGWQQEASDKLTELIKDKGRVFDTDIAHSLVVTSRVGINGEINYQSQFKVIDYGLFHQIAKDPIEITTDKLFAESIQILDNEAANKYKDHWFHHKEMLLGKVCRTILIKGNSEHPVLKKIPSCRHFLAREYTVKKDFYKASVLLSSLINSDYTPPKMLHQGIYNEFFLTDMGRIGFSKSTNKTLEYQALVARVLPAVEIRPVCDNVLVANILELGRITTVDINLLYLKELFGHCPNLEKAFRAVEERISNAPPQTSVR